MFSVIMPAHNEERYIGAAVQSILDQTYPHWECIIVDDGSTDATYAIARRYAERDDRITVLRHDKNRGLAPTYQTALDAARYPWVVVLDADDRAFPHRLERYAQAIRQHPEVIAWGGYAHYVNDAGRLLFVTDMGPKTPEEFYQKREHAEPIMMLHSTFAFQRELGIEAGGYQDQGFYAPDIDFMDRLSDYGVMLTLPEPLAYYRIHAASTTFTRFVAQAEHLRYFWERRAAANAGETLTYEAFLERRKRVPWLQRMQERAADYGRMYWRRAGLNYGERALLPLLKNLFLSLILNPGFMLDKVRRQVRLRVLRRA